VRAIADDVVLIAGKGHETHQEIDGRRLPFSDTLEAEEALARWGR
jgi:UDP-N-acetylmuramoyl-L-alanyl-D-glutamate--2,6-diaminopimelate ligase